MKKKLKKIILSNPATRSLWYKAQERKFSSSDEYWKSRYQKGGNSGHGSYGVYAEFKANILNNFVKENGITTVIEFGCGDGNQTTMFKFPSYTGLDVSPEAISINKDLFSADTTKNFFLYSPDHFIDNNNVFSAELSLSLDVIYHLVEDNIYKTHLTHVFESSSKFVAIYANNEESPQVNPHVKTRNFTKDIEVMFPEWSLLEVIEGEPTSDETIPRVDFFIFKKA